MTPQVINAGKIRFHNSSDNANQHFDNLRQEYADALNRLRAFVDDAIDAGDFVHASESVGVLNNNNNLCVGRTESLRRGLFFVGGDLL